MAENDNNLSRPVIVSTPDPPTTRASRGGGNPKTTKPTRERQSERLDGKFSQLQKLLDGQAESLVTSGIPDSDPELALVFEVVGETKDLVDAFRKVGMEPLVELEDSMHEEDLGVDFARSKPKKPNSEPIKKFVHAAMTNEAALKELLKLWRHWRSGKRMISGFGAFTNLFALLFDVRPWGAADRVRTTGLIERLEQQFADGVSEIPLQIELWFRGSAERRKEAESAVRESIEQIGGTVQRSAVRPEIGYHGLAAVLPATALESVSLTELESVQLLKTPGILYVRPGGQSPGEQTTTESSPSFEATDPGELGEPVVAILDGLPAANHPRLRERLELIDPDDWASLPDYTSERRRHGTMVSSAIVWGDLGSQFSPSTRKVVVRPILRPDMASADQVEGIPWDQLPADLTIRAVRDVLDAFPSVQIFTVAVGDSAAPFDTVPSAWARAIDHLSYEHNVLFITSAGNHLGPLPIDRKELDSSLPAEERDDVTATALGHLVKKNRLLPPAESMNSLTIGAAHSDATDVAPLGYVVDPWGHGSERPSPISAVGRGIRRSIKPDLMAPGGRVFYTSTPSGESIKPLVTGKAPGVAVASPPDRELFAVGTTFAASEVARRSADLIDLFEREGTFVSPETRPVAAKALLVHGAELDRTRDFGAEIDKMAGHGFLARDFVKGCPTSRATLPVSYTHLTLPTNREV